MSCTFSCPTSQVQIVDHEDINLSDNLTHYSQLNFPSCERDKSLHCYSGGNQISAEQTKLFSPVLLKSDMLSPSYMSPTPCPLNQTSARTWLTLLNCCWSAAGGAVDVVARVLWTGREPGSAVPWGTTPSGLVSVSPPPSSVRGHWVTQHIGCMVTWSAGLTPAVTLAVQAHETWHVFRKKIDH